MAKRKEIIVYVEMLIPYAKKAYQVSFKRRFPDKGQMTDEIVEELGRKFHGYMLINKKMRSVYRKQKISKLMKKAIHVNIEIFKRK